MASSPDLDSAAPSVAPAAPTAPTAGWRWLSKALLDCKLFNSSGTLFLFLAAVRLLNALTLRTYFQADEYWQALEPAHQVVYGYGFLTWEWRSGLRSFLHPLLYATVYKIVDGLGLGYTALIASPKVLDGLIAAVGDIYLYHLAKKITSSEVIARLTTVMSILASFNWYCSTRSFSNSLELHLTTAALYYFPVSSNRQLLTIALTIAAFCCMTRPTNVVFWLYYGARYLQRVPAPEKLVTVLIAGTVGASVFGIDMIVNREFYGDWTVPLVEFLNFNVAKSLSSFYGVSRPDFYFFQAIPVLLLNLLPFFLYGLWKEKTNSRLRDPIVVSLIYLLTFSLIQHKEFRFIYPLMPFFLIFCSYGAMCSFSKWSKKTTQLVSLLTLTLSTFLSFYFSIYHESGVIAITGYLREQVLEDRSNVSGTIDIGFLTPCHSTPYQSYFHLDPTEANIWWLTCEPPLHLNSTEGLKEYRDESDQFYDDPSGFLEKNLPAWGAPNVAPVAASWPHAWPKYLVIFEHLEPFLKEYLEGSPYSEYHRLFNSRFHWDYRRTGDLIVYRRA